MTGPSQVPRSARLPLIVGFAVLAVLIAGLGGWAMSTSIAGAVVASGKVEVQSHRQTIQHPDGGVVETVLVKDGDVVARGQIILQFDSDRLRAELSMAEAQYFELLARSARLEAERDGADRVAFPPELTGRAAADASIASLMHGQHGLFAARVETLAGQRDQLQERIAQIESQISGVEAQIDALVRQSDLIAAEMVNKRSLLARGLIPVSTVMALEREQARLDGQRGELVASAAQARGRIVETRLELLGLDAGRREEASTELRDLGVQLMQLTDKRAVLTEQIARLDVRAPVAGAVHGLQVAGRDAVVQPADTIGFIVPLDRPMVVTAQVSPREVDNVHPGQPARLRFTTFSSRTTPELAGYVTVVSADVFEDNATRQSYFSAEITLNAGEIDKLGAVQILPGMPVEVMMTTGERPVMSYLLKPVTDYFARAFRES